MEAVCPQIPEETMEAATHIHLVAEFQTDPAGVTRMDTGAQSAIQTAPEEHKAMDIPTVPDGVQATE